VAESSKIAGSTLGWHGQCLSRTGRRCGVAGRFWTIEVLEAAGVLISVTIGFLVLAALIALVVRWFE